jgi:glycosyltransferase involved in cell wall biosynthesis
MNPCDVALIHQPGYPYERSAEAGWIASILEDISPLRVAVVLVWDAAPGPRALRYELPATVQALTEIQPARPGQRGQAARHGAAPTGAAREVEPLIRLFLGAPIRLPTRDRESELWNAIRALARLARAHGPRSLLQPALLERVEAAYLELSEPALPYRNAVTGVVRALTSLAELLAAPVPAARVIHSLARGPAALLAAVHAEERGVPLVVTRASPPDRSSSGGLAGVTGSAGSWAEQVKPLSERLDTAYQELDRLVARRADRVVVPSYAAVKRCLKQGLTEDQALLIDPGVEIDPLASVFTRRERREAGPVRRVVFAGRLVPEDHGFRQACHLRSQILGMGRLLRISRELSLNEVLVGADVACVLSPSEDPPEELLRVMGAGVPVVVTLGGGAEEVLRGRDGEPLAGRVVPPGDSLALSNAVMATLNDPEGAKRVAATGRRRIVARHRRSASVERLRETYDELLQRTTSREVAHATPRP